MLGPLSSFTPVYAYSLVILPGIMSLNNPLSFDDYQMFMSILDFSPELRTNDASEYLLSLLCLVSVLELNMVLNILIFLLSLNLLISQLSLLIYSFILPVSKTRNLRVILTFSLSFHIEFVMILILVKTFALNNVKRKYQTQMSVSVHPL